MKIFRGSYQEYSDEQLMKKIQIGDVKAFEELYDRYSQRLLRYFYRMLGGDEEKSQDFVQETFLKVVEKTEYFDIERKFATWLYTISYNLCKNEYRRMEVRKIVEKKDNLDDLLQDSKEISSSPDVNIDRASFKQALMSELDKLDFTQKSVFLLRFQENLSIEEIADLMDCKPGTVKSRLYYVIQKLSYRLHDYNPFLYEVKHHD